MCIMPCLRISVVTHIFCQGPPGNDGPRGLKGHIVSFDIISTVPPINKLEFKIV